MVGYARRDADRAMLGELHEGTLADRLVALDILDLKCHACRFGERFVDAAVLHGRAFYSPPSVACLLLRQVVLTTHPNISEL